MTNEERYKKALEHIRKTNCLDVGLSIYISEILSPGFMDASMAWIESYNQAVEHYGKDVE